MPTSAPLTGEFLAWSMTASTRPVPRPASTADGDGRRSLSSQPSLTPSPATLGSYFAFSSVQYKSWSPADDAKLKMLTTKFSGDFKAVEREAKFPGHGKMFLERRALMLGSRPETR